MEKNFLKIKGGRPLKGEIEIKGYKNSMPKDMIAALLTNDDCILRNISHVRDIEIISDMIKDMGGECEYIEEDALKINAKNVHPLDLQFIEKYTGISRIPTLATGTMLARFGEAIMIIPGGCNIGARPINFHVEALKKMGAEIPIDLIYTAGIAAVEYVLHQNLKRIWITGYKDSGQQNQ